LKLLKVGKVPGYYVIADKVWRHLAAVYDFRIESGEKSRFVRRPLARTEFGIVSLQAPRREIVYTCGQWMPAGRRCWWPHFVLTDGWIIYLWTALDGCLSVGPSFRSVPNLLPKFLLRKLDFPGVPLFHDLCLPSTRGEESKSQYRSLAYIIHVMFVAVIDNDQQFANGDN